MTAVSLHEMQSKEEWGGRAHEDRLSCARAVSTYEYLVVHHCATPNAQVDQRTEQEHMQFLQDYHQQTLGWCDIGYHYGVGKEGTVFEGSPVENEGRHEPSVNANSLGVVFHGDYGSRRLSNGQWEAGIQLLAYLCQTFGVSPANIQGHRDFTATECPGQHIYTRLDEMRAAVAALLDGVSSETRSLSNGDEGKQVATLQHQLIRNNQAALEEYGVDGHFGQETEEAVQDVQVAYAISHPEGEFYGVAGPATHEKLREVNVLQRGDQGRHVRMLQEHLLHFTVELPSFGADGDFGAETENGVTTFQRHNQLPENGIADRTTLTVLDTDRETIFLQRGDIGSAVRRLQRLLMEEDIDLPQFGIDGDYGQETQDAVATFQEREGLEVTGEAQEQTLEKIGFEK